MNLVVEKFVGTLLLGFKGSLLILGLGNSFNFFSI